MGLRGRAGHSSVIPVRCIRKRPDRGKVEHHGLGRRPENYETVVVNATIVPVFVSGSSTICTRHDAVSRIDVGRTFRRRAQQSRGKK